MKTKILSLLVILAIAVASCQKDEADKPVVLQDVSFGIEHVDPFGLKNDDFDIECPADLTPVKAQIKINGVVYEPLVFFLNERWYTQAIKLAPATYTIEEFYLLDAVGDTIMATPAAGSVYAPYVENNTVAKTIVVDAFVKKEFKMWVLCYEEAKYTEFGFFWFRLNRIVVREKCFFGDLCVKNPLEYVGSNYELQPTGLQIDMPAIFKIHAYKSTTDGPIELPNSPFTNNIAPNYGVGAPVCVQWGDNIDIAGEEFIFELWILVAVGSTFDYVLFQTWTFVDDEMVGINGDQVIDFVLGNCSYGGTPPFLQLAPYMNLPETASVYIDWGDPGYINLTITASPAGDLPTGLQTGWCGAEDVSIYVWHTYTMHLYNSLYPQTWPAGMSFSGSTINKVNWMFNNLQAYGFPAFTGNTIPAGQGPLTQAEGVIIQEAIWNIIHGSNYSGMALAMANDADDKGDFIPLPGGWAAILMVANNNPASAQIVFTVVDP